eukprot:1814045-Pyramimonas_sp.AAC.1
MAALEPGSFAYVRYDRGRRPGRVMAREVDLGLGHRQPLCGADAGLRHVHRAAGHRERGPQRVAFRPIGRGTPRGLSARP